MKKTDTQIISKALEAFFSENPQLAEKLAETRLMNSWEKVSGTMVMRYTVNMFIKNQCLYVKLNSSIVKNELTICREKLIQNLNKEAGSQVINNIRFI
jgi:predicted nucleic acid-binding Zn ribbon protein